MSRAVFFLMLSLLSANTFACRPMVYLPSELRAQASDVFVGKVISAAGDTVTFRVIRSFKGEKLQVATIRKVAEYSFWCPSGGGSPSGGRLPKTEENWLIFAREWEAIYQGARYIAGDPNRDPVVKALSKKRRFNSPLHTDLQAGQ